MQARSDLSSPSHQPRADMWSFACILAECYGLGPTFPGRNNPEQMVRACVRGSVPADPRPTRCPPPLA